MGISNEKIDAVLFGGALYRKKKQRRGALEAQADRWIDASAGIGEWRFINMEWHVEVKGHKTGDRVLVRRKEGTKQPVILGQKVGPVLFKVDRPRRENIGTTYGQLAGGIRDHV